MFPETLEGQGIRLRIVTPADAPALYAFLRKPEVYEPTSSDAWTLEGLQQWTADNVAGAALDKWCRYGIILSGHEEPVGGVGLFNIDLHNQRAEIGYELSPDHWGKGLMTRAAAIVLAWAFANGFHRIEATVMAGNRRSERVLEKLGFEREASMRDYKLVRGTFRNYSLWALLAP